MPGQIRLLIMTPSWETRDGIAKLLELDDDFYLVGTARTALEGLQRAGELRPDIVLTGMSQTDLSGLEFIKRLKEKDPSIGIVIVSLADKPQTIQDAYSVGANAYIVKPFEYDELEAAIRQTYAQIRPKAESVASKHAKTKASIFVSYSRSDWDEYVDPLVAYVRDVGFDVWVDQHLLHGGDYWFDKVSEALEASNMLILCVSPEALSSKFVKMEYRYFFMRDKPIIPVICRPVDNLPAELLIIQHIDYDLDLLVGYLEERGRH